jgi:hypothetical protein
MTNTDKILAELTAKRDSVDAAIRALTSGSRRYGRGRKPGTRKLSPAARRKIADAAKARWARAKREGRNHL